MRKKINFESENINVDWISFKFKLLELTNQTRLVNYLFKLGFNSYIQFGKLRKSEKEELRVSQQNIFSVLFVTEGPFGEGTLLQFSGKNANHFHQYAKTNSIDWDFFSDSVLNRLNLYYIPDLVVDTKSVEEFFYSCCATVKLTVNYDKKKKGPMLKLGNRGSDRFSEIYIENDRLKFEHKMKGSFIKLYSHYLMTDCWDEFEFLLSQQFFHYFGTQLLSVNSDYLTWLAKKIRSLQPLSNLTFKTDYFNPSLEFNEQKRVTQFLKLLMYVRDLDYRWEIVEDIRYRVVIFKLNDFLKFLHGSDCSSHYKLKQLRDFCSEIQSGFFLTLFTDEYFQSLISVPKIKLYKETHWIGKFWIVDDLFYYSYPFSFPDIFQPNLSKDQFSVLFEIIKCFNSPNLEKRIYVKQFIKDYPSTLSNQNIRKMKTLFLEAIEILENNQLIESRFKVFCDGELKSVERLTTQNISEGFLIYEKINFFQLPDSEKSTGLEQA